MNSSIPQQLARQFREIYLEGHWVATNLKEQLHDMTWQLATEKVEDCNSILALTYHISYYVGVVSKVLEGGPLDGNDKLSFNHPAINSEGEWQQFLDDVFRQGKRFAELVEQLPEEQLWQPFEVEKYGNYYRNIQVIIEYTYYHTGQIAFIKKLVKREI